ncbi:MAG: hypothetical protein QOJ26_755, partial [Thermoplasmata archaeon]|nr:hypothetical protein [Thermoplasmata archaeon]
MANNVLDDAPGFVDAMARGFVVGVASMLVVLGAGCADSTDTSPPDAPSMDSSIVSSTNPAKSAENASVQIADNRTPVAGPHRVSLADCDISEGLFSADAQRVQDQLPPGYTVLEANGQATLLVDWTTCSRLDDQATTSTYLSVLAFATDPNGNVSAYALEFLVEGALASSSAFARLESIVVNFSSADVPVPSRQCTGGGRAYEVKASLFNVPGATSRQADSNTTFLYG